MNAFKNYSGQTYGRRNFNEMNSQSEATTPLGNFRLTNLGNTISRIWNLDSPYPAQLFVDYNATFPPEIRRRNEEDFSAASSGEVLWPTDSNVYKRLKESYRDTAGLYAEIRREVMSLPPDYLNLQVNSVVRENPYDEIFQAEKVANFKSPMSNRMPPNTIAASNARVNRYCHQPGITLSEINSYPNLGLEEPKVTPSIPDIEHYFNFIKSIFGEEMFMGYLKKTYGVVSVNKEKPVHTKDENKEGESDNGNGECGDNSLVGSNSDSKPKKAPLVLQHYFYCTKQINEYNEYMKRFHDAIPQADEENCSEYSGSASNEFARQTTPNLNRNFSDASYSIMQSAVPYAKNFGNETKSIYYQSPGPSGVLKAVNYGGPNNGSPYISNNACSPVQNIAPQQLLQENADNGRTNLEEYSTLMKRMFRQTNDNSNNTSEAKNTPHSSDDSWRYFNDCLERTATNSATNEEPKPPSFHVTPSSNSQRQVTGMNNDEYQSFVRSLFRSQTKSNAGTQVNFTGNDLKREAPSSCSVSSSKTASNRHFQLRENQLPKGKEETASIKSESSKAFPYRVQNENRRPYSKNNPFGLVMLDVSRREKRQD